MSTILRLSPNTPAAVICEDEVTIARLMSFLDAAVIDSEIDEDGDIYVSDGLSFPCWIDVLKEKKMISFFTYYAPESLEGQDWFEVLNDMNTNVVVVQFSWNGKAVWGQYWMSYDGGLNVRQFIKMLRNFSGAFRAGIEIEGNREKKIILT